jgi:hypothetical protein
MRMVEPEFPQSSTAPGGTGDFGAQLRHAVQAAGAIRTGRKIMKTAGTFGHRR